MEIVNSEVSVKVVMELRCLVQAEEDQWVINGDKASWSFCIYNSVYIDILLGY